MERTNEDLAEYLAENVGEDNAEFGTGINRKLVMYTSSASRERVESLLETTEWRVASVYDDSDLSSVSHDYMYTLYHKSR